MRDINTTLRAGFSPVVPEARIEAELTREMREAREDADLDAALAERTEEPRQADMIGAALAPGPVQRAVLTIPPVLQASTSVLAGQAGTGKTYLAKAWVAQEPGVVLAATTGIAATNLGEGTTINALLKYFDSASLEENFVSGRLTATLGKLYKSGVRRILCDEVSMMDARQITVITRALKELGGRAYAADVQLTDEVRASMEAEGLNPEERLPIGLTFLGDACQLPPVDGAFFFTSPEWPEYAAHTHTLTEIRRQSDRPFMEALQACRRGDVRAVLDFFGPRLVRQSDPNFAGTTIYATNDACARFNALKMDRLRTTPVAYPTRRWGTARSDWKNIPDVLTLKEGALVMLLANKRGPGLAGMPGKLIYANGDLGTVRYLADDRIGVELQRTGQVQEVGYLSRANTVPVDGARKKELRETGLAHLITDDGKFETVGTVDYLPVRIAYASTVHRSQGLSLDRVQVNLNEGMFKQPSMTYVALSRARTAEGLRLVGTTAGLAKRVTVHAQVKEWI